MLSFRAPPLCSGVTLAICRWSGKLFVDIERFICQLSKTKCGYKPKSKGLSYSRLRELVLEAFKDIVPDISAIGTHSLRSGGATRLSLSLAP